MRSAGPILGIALVTLGLPALGAAQGLGDVAARAREEREARAREAKPTESRSYSNEDLEGLPEVANEESEGTVSTMGEASPSSAGPRAPVSSPEEDRAARLKPYENAVARAEARVQSLEATIESLQQRLNPMSTTYVYGGTGGPVGGAQADEEQRVRRQLDAAEGQLGDAREALAAAEAALAQARRVPASSRD